MAELGLTGFGLFVSLIAMALGHARLRAGNRSLSLVGGVTGTGAFLLTCFGGHPLLIREVAYAFWMLLGAVAALGAASRVREPAQEESGPSRPGRLAMVALAVLAVSVPPRVVREVRSARFDNVAIGYSRWYTAEDGTRFRWADLRSRFFVPTELASVAFQLRLEEGRSGPVAVEVRLDGRVANRVLVDADWWTAVRVVLQPRDGRARARMIELDVDGMEGQAPRREGQRPEGGLMVGKFSGS